MHRAALHCTALHCTTLLEIVNRDRVVIDLLKIKQGNKSNIDFFAEVEDQVKLTRANMEQITEN